MRIGRETIGSGPLLSPEASDRVFNAPGLRIKGRPQSAVRRTLAELTTEFLNRTYNVTLSRRDVEPAAVAFRQFRRFVEKNGTALFQPMPNPGQGYFDAQERWFKSELAAAIRRTGVGRAPNGLHAFSVPRLLALYAIAFRTDPHAGNPNQAGPAARFLETYSQELVRELEVSEFADPAERALFSRVWTFPKSISTLIRRNNLGPEPSILNDPAAKALSKLNDIQVLGAWGHVAAMFISFGGMEPYAPKQVLRLGDNRLALPAGPVVIIR